VDGGVIDGSDGDGDAASSPGWIESRLSSMARELTSATARAENAEQARDTAGEELMCLNAALAEVHADFSRCVRMYPCCPASHHSTMLISEP